MQWVVIFSDTSEMVAARKEKDRIDAHLSFVRTHPQISGSGALTKRGKGAFCGGMWIVDAETVEEVERIIERDPLYDPRYRSADIYSWGRMVPEQKVGR
ncbi:hypothetical protein ACMU_06700 [Actibacterium mucosum KCTC 23349]|uniref:YCII-related domain-containing protein n=1 Tax=Actibacterium mucosum KCTC 23349 TaxID=1454373 RepID=A0A037ZM53_9RHOB|nr:YciI family protein [Actibacterium mucosum]KAJ56627.1 hypothetical protein ACMU_06700 [Actibacterium mucosum KCTC 23349]